ncbi:hypothetical protein DENSPDRAFT_517174 [Dentipellis sp. KUC8613]|nr:hypothetical protein DENSPDRAFT_517174 [Dentipellis sp. KUC8613]
MEDSRSRHTGVQSATAPAMWRPDVQVVPSSHPPSSAHRQSVSRWPRALFALSRHRAVALSRALVASSRLRRDLLMHCRWEFGKCSVRGLAAPFHWFMEEEEEEEYKFGGGPIEERPYPRHMARRIATSRRTYYSWQRKKKLSNAYAHIGHEKSEDGNEPKLQSGRCLRLEFGVDP